MNKMDKKRVVYKHVANYIHSILSSRIVVFQVLYFLQLLRSVSQKRLLTTVFSILTWFLNLTLSTELS